MDAFVTLDRAHPDFEKYLLGRLPQNQIAVPVRSLHIHSRDEKVTFQIFKRDETLRPSMFFVIMRLMRLDLIAFTFLPVIAVFAAAVFAATFASHERVSAPLFAMHTGLHAGLNFVLMGFTLLSLFFLHGAIYCRNDFIDHLNGIDRLNEKGGSRVIQNGWVRATTVQRLFHIFLAASFFFAIPVLMAFLSLWWLAALGGGIGIFGYSFLRQGVRSSQRAWLAGDLMAFLAMGPLLTWGANIVALKPLSSVECILLGTGFGLSVVVYLEIRHLISLVVDDTSGLRTMAVALGFDRAKRVIAALFLLIGVCLVALSQHALWSLIVAGLFALVTIAMAARMLRIGSPLASILPSLLKQVIIVQLLYGIIVIAFLAFIKK